MEEKKIPRHVGFIMDGNGRWAHAQDKPRSFGHQAGYAKVKDVVRWCKELGISVATFYAFSTENWNRPKREVAFLMRLLQALLQREVAELCRERIRLRVIGDREGLKKFRPRLVGLIEAAEKQAATGDFTLQIAFNYGGRTEITQAVQQIIRDGLKPEAITEQEISRRLWSYDPRSDDPGSSDIDLLVRTGGQYRLSGFQLWEVAYTEILVTDVLWPDFSRTHLEQAIAWFGNRERKFGGLPGQKQ